MRNKDGARQVAYMASRRDKAWVRVYRRDTETSTAIWFETDDPSAWGTLHHTMSDVEIRAWAKKFAERWGKHRGPVKLKERELMAV